jgi:uncharacterized protein (DUF169 family)
VPETAAKTAAQQTVDMATAAKEIEQYVRPETFPLGIRVIQQGQPVPDKARQPWRDLGAKVTVCQGISMARRYGWTLAMGTEDLSCPIALVAFGFRPHNSYYDDGNLVCGMYTENMETAARTEADVVLVYGNSAQAMKMVAAALYKTGGSLPSTFSARADCADIIIKTKQTDHPQVILPCYGDRVFGQTQDHEMAFTIPWAQMPTFIEGLKGTHAGGVRYPVPHFLRYTPQFPPTYEKLRGMWDEEAHS